MDDRRGKSLGLYSFASALSDGLRALKEYQTIRDALAKGGLHSPMNYYKVNAFGGNVADHQGKLSHPCSSALG